MTPFAVSSCGVSGNQRREIAAGPRGDQPGGIVRVLGVGQKMIRPIERHEALGMPGCQKDPRSMLDADHFVARSVHDEEGSVEARHMLFNIVLADFLDEAALDGERPAGDPDFRELPPSSRARAPPNPSG